MKITKSQLQKIIKEEILKEAGGFPGRRFGGSMADLDAEAKMRETDFLSIPGKKATLKFLKQHLQQWRPDNLGALVAALETSRFDLTEEVLKIAQDELATYTEHSKD